MSSPPLPDPDALSADGLKRLVVRLLARVAALEEENRRLGEENARLKDLPKRSKLAPAAPDRLRRQAYAPGHGGARPDLVLAPRLVRYRRELWVTPDGRELVA